MTARHPDLKGELKSNMRMNRTEINTLSGDITKADFADAIVNSSNEELFGDGGMNGAVHKAAGDQLRTACEKLGGCRAGEARITDAYALPCKYIIHTVAPVWKDGRHGEDKILESCYKNVLQIASSCGIRSIGLSSIGTGKRKVPVEKAAAIAVRTVFSFVQENPEAFDRITWIFSNDEKKKVYDNALSLMEDVLKIREEVNAPVEPVFPIGYENKVIQVQMIKCLHEGHTITLGKGLAVLMDAEGRRKFHTFGVGYCEECGHYYTLLREAVSMKKEGVPLCRMLTKKDYEKEFKNPAYSTNPRALMEQYGYTIFDLGNLSDKQRQTILSTLVEHKLINASATVGYLEDLIKIGKDNPFARIEEENIEKWKTDRDFLSLYQV